MRPSFISALAAFSGTELLASAAVIQDRAVPSLPPLPITEFKGNPFVRPLKFDEVLNGATLVNTTEGGDAARPKMNLFAVSAAAATCSNPRYRHEWDSYSDSDKQAFISAIRCLQGKPSSGRYRGSKSKYDDLTALHQQYTPNVHSNAKFLIWHRYFVWTFEKLLRDQCGFDRDMPWFDETKYSGRFSQSSVFSSKWFGAIAVNGGCVPDGQFANVPINIGPGPSNAGAHCLQRKGDAALTQNTNKDWVNACHNSAVYPTYKDMAACAEGGAHAYGHNGVGGVMGDVYASPGDPVFWLHHLFIDHNYRIWQNMDEGARTSAAGINGVDVNGRTLTLDTMVVMDGIVPDVPIRDIINTKSTLLCYRYDY